MLSSAKDGSLSLDSAIPEHGKRGWYQGVVLVHKFYRHIHLGVASGYIVTLYREV